MDLIFANLLAGSELLIVGGWVVAIIVILIVLLIVAFNINIWLEAASAGAKVSMFSLVGMWFRKVDSQLIVRNRIAAWRTGIKLSTDMLETHYLARGNVNNVVRALIAANRASINLDFQKAAAIDLAGRDVLDAVHTSVNPKVIDCPETKSGKMTIDAVAQDGIQLKVKARVTVRTNIEKLVGGATQETIIARVGEGIVSAIGSAMSHKDVLENPDTISKTVLANGLDSGTAYKIISIDIADIDVGENIGAKLQGDKAEADKRVAQAKAEERRALAVAFEQEMKSETCKNRATVVLAQSEVPKAIAHAFRAGNITKSINV